jgi:4-alpha-glucanotransferase
VSLPVRPASGSTASRGSDPWGIADGYEDNAGVWRPLAPETRAALEAAMGIEPGSASPGPAPVKVVRAGEDLVLDSPCRLTLEDGASLDVERALPPDVPLGYHDLRPLRGGSDVATRLIVSPGRCPLPPERAWGWAAQLYATRSRQSWGIGDLADLRTLGRWAARLGARVLLINPLAAPLPLTDQQPSPYCPSTRRYLNPLYLRIEDVPGAAELGADLDRIAESGRALNVDRRIDRARVFRLKAEALERLWSRARPHDDFQRFLREEGASLHEFAIFCALAERFDGGWRRWPSEYRRPDAAAVARFADEQRERVAFHEWLQWLLDRQLAAAAAEIPVMQDLPIGVDPDGADAWAWQDVLATGATVGAPPDRYVKRGQDWGLPPFVPHRLRANGYAPFVRTIRAALRHAGGLRIDHVMGLFRLFWVPPGRSPAEGGYVRYPADDLLAIVALESHRAGAFVVGEDLGTVEAGVRERLAAHAILSYRVMWFESEPPARYPSLAMAAITTHDLPTIAGLWTGADIAEQKLLGLDPDEPALAEIRARLAQATGVGATGAVSDVIEAAHRRLAEAPSRLVTATLEDALAVAERPNMPGTVTGRPNWSMALPAALDVLPQEPLALRVAAALAGRGGGRARS